MHNYIQFNNSTIELFLKQFARRHINNIEVLIF